MPKPRSAGAVLLLCFALVSPPALPAAMVDLTRAIVVHPADFSPPENKAIQMLVEETEKRSRIMWPTRSSWPQTNVPVIAICTRNQLHDFAPSHEQDLSQPAEANAPEGYRLKVTAVSGNTNLFIIGNDARGVLFGIGRLLRELHMKSGQVSVADNLDIVTAPKYALP